MTFLFPFPSHSHRIIPIPTVTHSHSNTAFPFPFSHHLYSHAHPFRQRLYIGYLKAEKYVYCLREFKTKYEVKAEALLIKLITHQSSSL